MLLPESFSSLMLALLVLSSKVTLVRIYMAYYYYCYCYCYYYYYYYYYYYGTAVLLIDASNVFNALNRAAALHNIRILCPPIATYAINTYRQPARLFIIGGRELKSAEGTTQGDSLVMAIYASSLQPLITHLGISSDTKQCWYADDASGSGSLEAIKQWWDELTEAGPNLGYYPNTKKCWLITKPEKVEDARVIFEGTAIIISTQGQRHLGAAQRIFGRIRR